MYHRSCTFVIFLASLYAMSHSLSYLYARENLVHGNTWNLLCPYINDYLNSFEHLQKKQLNQFSYTHHMTFIFLLIKYILAVICEPSLTHCTIRWQIYCNVPSHTYTPDAQTVLYFPLLLTFHQTEDNLFKNLHKPWVRFLLYHLNITYPRIYSATLNWVPWDIQDLLSHNSIGTL